jgi:hypothetical protein
VVGSGVHPKVFSPSSVQFKSEINGACLCKRHQKRHLEFCTAYLLSRQYQSKSLLRLRLRGRNRSWSAPTLVSMTQGKRPGLSATQQIPMWSPWKAGQSFHEIGRVSAMLIRQFDFAYSLPLRNTLQREIKNGKSENLGEAVSYRFTLLLS